MVLWRNLAAAFICLPMATLCTSALAAQSDRSANSPSNALTLNTTPANGVSIAVADFSGADKELGRFLADTLLTDLAQSERLHMVERAEIGKALTELKLQSTGLAEPQDVKKVGKLLGAERMIVGSYLVRDNQLLINARLLDVRNGRVTPGGAANVTGNRDNVLLLVHQLAHRFHKRVTGAELLLENERPTGTAPAVPPLDNTPDEIADPRADDTAARGKVSSDRSADNDNDSSNGYNVRQPNAGSDSPPAYASSPSGASFNTSVPPLFALPSGVSPLRTVMSNDMTRLLAGAGSRGTFFTSGRDSVPVSRLRALVALVKASGFSAPIAANPSALASLLPDAQAVPLWATGYLVTAVRQGLWPTTRALHPADTANWGFLSAIVGRLNVVNRIARQQSGKSMKRSVPGAVAHARLVSDPRVTPAAPTSRWSPGSGEKSENGRSEDATIQAVYTGLLVEARDLPVLRSMSARIVDAEGQAVYPDPRHIPDDDFLQDHGMADYYHNGADTPRAGNHPLIVRAMNVVGDDIIISMETAARIREASRRDGFLRQWHVGILLDEGR
jgi:TolB-like protein